jgi:hypothetical protein
MSREEFDVEDTSKRSAMHGTGKQSLTLPPGLSMWRAFKEGSRNIDIIPFKVTEEILRFSEKLRFASPGKWYGECSYWAHGQIGVSPEQYTCPARTFGLKCPICEDVSELYQSPHKDDQKKAGKLKAKDRQLFLIYDHEQKERSVQLWEVANWNFGKHLDKFVEGARAQDKESYRRYFHPYDGYTIRITASPEVIEGGKPNTIWTPHAFYKRDEDLPESIIMHGYDLHSIVRCLSYHDLDAIYRGEVDVQEDDDNTPPTGRTRDPERNRTPDRERERIQTRSEPEKPREEQRREPEKTREPEKAREPERQKEPEKPAPKKEEKVEFGEKDLVSFMFMDRRIEGIIEDVDRKAGTASVKVDGQKRPLIFEFEELTLVVKSDPSFKLTDTLKDDPAASDPKDGKSSRQSDWDTEEDNRVKEPKKRK